VQKDIDDYIALDTEMMRRESWGKVWELSANQVDRRIDPIITLGTPLLNMIGNLV
jgi:hypothetical protein